MENKTKMIRIVNIVSDILLSVLLIVCGILFALSCYSIYSSAEKQMFTYASIGAAFEKIQIIVYITLAFVVIGAILSLIFPRKEAKLRSPKRAKSIYTSLLARVDESKISDNISNRLTKERKLRKLALYFLFAISALEVVLPLFYLFNPSTFPAEAGKYNDEVLRGILFYSCMLLPVAVYGVVYSILTAKSYIRETEALKEALMSGAKADIAVSTEASKSKIMTYITENKKPIKLGLRIALIGCAVIFIAMGIANGGMTDVLIKAVNICAECIGLG